MRDTRDSASAGGTVAPEEWQPQDGVERTMYTVLGTSLTGIAFAAVLFGIASALGLELNVTRGLLLGLASFACCALAPSIGLPPKPPVAAAADLHAAQVWWVTSAIATAAGPLGDLAIGRFVDLARWWDIRDRAAAPDRSAGADRIESHPS